MLHSSGCPLFIVLKSIFFEKSSEAEIEKYLVSEFLDREGHLRKY